MKEAYDSYINSQKKGYEITAKIIGHVIKRLEQAGYISADVQVTGRIKSFRSTYENTNKKKVDDCFGIRIVGTNEDLIAIKNQLEKILVVTQTKDHRKKKDTAYNGIHQMAYLQKQYADHSRICYENFPLIEIQYWSRETQRRCMNGDLKYANYKKGDYKEFMEELKERGTKDLNDLPEYYEIIGNKIIELNSIDTLYKLYPDIYARESIGMPNLIPNEER